MSVALNGWHPGERDVQTRLHYAEPMAMAYTWVDNHMPEQHSTLLEQLPFVPLTTLDDQGRPWSSLVAGASGKPGFIRCRNETALELSLQIPPGDPLLKNLDLFSKNKKTLAAGLGIQFTTRRRNKFAGSISSVEATGEHARRLKLEVNQTIG